MSKPWVGESNRQRVVSEETKAKMSAAQKGKRCPPGCDCRRHHKKPVSQETRRRMSEAQKAHAAANPMTPQRLQKMSDAAKAKWGEEDFRLKQQQRWDPERRAAMSEAMTKRWQDPEYRQRNNPGNRKGLRKDNSPAHGHAIWKSGHIMLTQQQGHPLANTHGAVFEHRKVLYDEIGPGPHPCHWHPMSGCGNPITTCPIWW